MTAKQPFFPHYGTNQVLTVSATSTPYSIGKSSKQLRVANTGSNIGYFRTYDSTAATPAATTADYAVPPGIASVVSRMGHDTVAVISALGTTFQVMPGEGF